MFKVDLLSSIYLSPFDLSSSHKPFYKVILLPKKDLLNINVSFMALTFRQLLPIWAVAEWYNGCLWD